MREDYARDLVIVLVLLVVVVIVAIVRGGEAPVRDIEIPRTVVLTQTA